MTGFWTTCSVLLLIAWSSRADNAEIPPLSGSPWSWRCEPKGEGLYDICVRILTPENTATPALSHPACRLTCGKFGTLWPKPKSVNLGKQLSYFLPHSISHTFVASEEDTLLLTEAFKNFMKILDTYDSEYLLGKLTWKSPEPIGYHKVNINIHIEGPSKSHLGLDITDEKYALVVTTDLCSQTSTANITAKTFFGARHGLETLAQLIDYEEIEKKLMIVNSADIKDEPAFPYRGLMLDTSRNFITVEAIKRTIDTMSANKLNTFHWHITDSYTFPLALKSLPKMAYYGTYSPRQVYLPEDVKGLVEYARVRGVRVVPELDAPAHVGFGWQWGPQEGLGNLTVCVDQEPWQEFCLQPPCGQLNIANQNIYTILGKIYQEMLDMFGPLDLFHFGGDEVNVHCWNTTEEIVTYMKSKNLSLTDESYYAQWSQFQNRAYDLLTEANGQVKIPGIIWTSHLTEKGHTNRYLNKEKYIIQIWSVKTDPLIKELLDQKYRLIFSNKDAWYLDCGFSAWVGEGLNSCSPYKGWQLVYDNSPKKIALNVSTEVDFSLILGGEAPLWTEQADSLTIDGRFWPRGAALGERLWSDPDHDWRDAEYRMVNHRQRLVKRGVQADRLQPEWCHQNQGRCYRN
ncbi:chitooligosaccharidolytic beta-N-acetylglucosaminidase [Hyalella azteca]|uniref:Beta-hexosaminidase n=1 Tax=Hyalella azteca TaxID=294128 RepID=A0A8B7PIX6_HYAAZ|nr:chitooligosaccharidolytic beta-N-acetylglucosaminidase [Hyalella azteca]XP_018025935.1 chitooligosaccharidolytic beta-N-acetylglucosaminidase [Hyalella azteca]